MVGTEWFEEDPLAQDDPMYIVVKQAYDHPRLRSTSQVHSMPPSLQESHKHPSVEGVWPLSQDHYDRCNRNVYSQRCSGSATTTITVTVI